MARWFSSRPRHPDVCHRTAGAIGQNRPADTVLVRVADGHALGRVHGAGVAQGDVLAQVVAIKGGPGPIGEPLGGNSLVFRVDADHAPAVAITDLVDPITPAPV